MRGEIVKFDPRTRTLSQPYFICRETLTLVAYSMLVLVPTLLLPAAASVSDLCHPSNPFPRA